MARNAKKLLSLVLAIAMLTALLPMGHVVVAEGESDTTLSALTYVFGGEVHTIALVGDDDKGATVQENRYNETLPYITKIFTADRLPVVSATPTVAGTMVKITPADAFPGTAKIAVTAVDGVTKRNYYVHFKFAPGSIGTVTNKVTTVGNVYKAFHDLQPMSLADLRELYQDLGPNYSKYENYCRSYVDRSLNTTGSAIVDVYTASNGDKIPSTLVPLQSGKTGDYVNFYQINTSGYFSMWMGTGTSSGNASSFFNGASWIATGNNDKGTAAGSEYFKTSNNDAITFTIDRGATLWVATSNATSANFVTNGWVYNNTSGYKLYHGDGTAFSAFFTKHFDAGTVNIPTYGTNITRMIMPVVMWDAPGSGNTALGSLTATWTGGSKDITLVPGQTTYNVKASSIPTIAATAADAASGAQVDVVQGTGMPGTASVTIVSGANTKVYTISYTLEGQDVIYADKTDTTGVSGVGYTVNNTVYPAVPAADQFTDPLNTANVGTYFWDFGDGNGPINITRSYCNYGAANPYLRNEGSGSGSSQYVYVKMDLSTIDTSRSVQQAILSTTLTGNSTMVYNGTNKSLYVDIEEVPETKWITGTGTGETAWSGTAPNKTIKAGLKYFPIVNKTTGMISSDVSQPYILTNMSVPDQTASSIPDIAQNAYSKRLGTVYVGQMAAGGNFGTITADVTKSVRDKLAAGKTTATFKLKITPNIYGYYIPAATKNDMQVTVATTGATRPKLEIFSAASGEYSSAEKKLAYIAIGDKSYYTGSTRTYAAGKTPIDLGAGFNADIATEQNINLLAEDLVGGKVGLNAIAKDANATVSINGATATADSQYALVGTVQGVATAQVAVTAQNGDVMTYHLKFTITDYVMSTDSSAATLSYTHPELGTQNVALVDGVTTYNAVLPYGIASGIPQISAVPNHMYSAVTSATQASSIPGSATITIRAENGATTTYTINYTQSSTPPASGMGTVTNLKYRDVDAVAPFMAVNGLQGVAPVDIYNNNITYPTQADKIAAAIDPTTNLYKNNDLRMYSDRTPYDGGGNGTGLSQQIGSQMEFAYIVKGEEATSPEFVSPHVTRILTKNDEKSKADSIPDAYSFTIDKPATVYIAWGSNAVPSTNILSNGWSQDTTGLRVARASISTLQYTQGENADNKYYSIPNGGSNPYTGVYTKHYAAGANVEIPSAGSTAGSGLTVYIIWDTVEVQTITDLKLSTPSNLSQGFGTTSKINFRATATPSVDVDRDQIEWYVNDVKQSTTGANFSYTPTEVGQYVVSVKVSNNAGATVDAKTITVAKADPVVTWPTIDPVTYAPGLTLADIPLEAGFAWATPTTQLRVPGGSYSVIYTPADTDHYKVVAHDVAVTVNKATQSTPALEVSKTSESVTITSVVGAEYGLKLKGSAGEVIFGSSNVFTGLTANTEYTAFIRMVATDNYEQSDAASIDVTTKSSIIYGDISGDGVIDISDVIMAAEIAVGTAGYTNQQKLASDVSGDGVTDISDVVLLAERAVGGTDPFPVE